MATTTIAPKKKSNRRRWIIGGALLLALLAGGGAWLFYGTRATSAQTATAKQPAVTVTRGSITQTVSGSGTITADQTLDLAFQTTGVVNQVHVQVGDTVKAGQVLATLDDRALQSKVTEAQASLDSAKATLTQKQNGNATAQELASAKASVTSAQAAYAAAVKDAAAGDATLRSLKATLDSAQVTLQKAQATYDRIAWRSDVGASSEAADLQTATISYQKAKADYDAQLVTSAPDTQSKIASALATLQQAQASLDKLTAPATDSDISIQQAAVTQAEQALKQAQLNLEAATLKAPFDGVITSVDVVPGSTASSTVMSLMSNSLQHVELKLSENDIVKAAVGQTVTLTSDSLSDWKADGKVSYISAAGTTSNGVVTYALKVDFADTDPRVKVGMTLNVDITTAQKDNVLVVPSSAILPKGSGYVVQVTGANGATQDVQVKTGVTDGTHTEITSGLSESQQIIALPTSSTATSSSKNNNQPGGGPPF